VAPVEEFPETAGKSLIRILLIAPFVLTRGALPGMYAPRLGADHQHVRRFMALVASPYNRRIVRQSTVLIGLTRTSHWRQRSWRDGQRHLPGLRGTPLVERQIDDLAAATNPVARRGGREDLLAPAARHQLLEPADIASPCVFLCGDSAAASPAPPEHRYGWTAR